MVCLPLARGSSSIGGYNGESEWTCLVNSLAQGSETTTHGANLPTHCFGKQNFIETIFFIVFCCFHTTITELSNYDRDLMAHKACNKYYLVLYRKSLTTPIWWESKTSKWTLRIMCGIYDRKGPGS